MTKVNPQGRLRSFRPVAQVIAGIATIVDSIQMPRKYWDCNLAGTQKYEQLPWIADISTLASMARKLPAVGVGIRKGALAGTLVLGMTTSAGAFKDIPVSLKAITSTVKSTVQITGKVGQLTDEVTVKAGIVLEPQQYLYSIACPESPLTVLGAL